MPEKKKFGIKGIYIILAIVIFLQVGLVTYRFIFEKEGNHTDEPWNFGLANSYYKPFIYGEEAKDSYLRLDDSSDTNIWVSGEYLKNYLTVQKGEQFSYDSVWYNQAHDMHPPLYFAVLHTICSFFPDTYSWWFAYVINIAAMIIGQIYFYRTAAKMCRSEVIGILACCMWGFCYGFTNLNLFLRMYSMLTMLSIMFIYYHVHLYHNQGNVRGDIIKIAVITFAGAMTQHMFLISAFGIAACFCFYYLFKKRFKVMFGYSIAVAGAVGLSFLAFPASFDHLFGISTTYFEMSMPFINRFRIFLSLLLNSICGIEISPWASGLYAYFLAAAIILAAIAVPLAYLFRKEEWFRRITKNVRGGLAYFFGHFDFMFLFLFIGTLFTLMFISYTVEYYQSTVYADKYLFMIFPWTVLCIVLAVKYILGLIRPIARYSAQITAVLVCVSVVFSTVKHNHDYLFPRNIRGEGGLETTVNEHSDYVVIVSFIFNMNLYADHLSNCHSAFFTDKSYVNFKDIIAQADTDNDLYVVIDSSMLAIDTEIESDGFLFVTEEESPETANDNDDSGKEEERSEGISEKEIIDDFETNIFPGHKLQFYSSEQVLSSTIHTYKVVPEAEYEYVPVIDATMEE